MIKIYFHIFFYILQSIPEYIYSSNIFKKIDYKGQQMQELIYVSVRHIQNILYIFSI